MDSSSVQPRKEEDDKKDVKPVRTLNRVPRACNACRKQKMRCEGADNPPCRRCRNTGLECLFEKPSREATLTGEAGLERIRSLEAHVSEIKHTQLTMSSALQEILSFMHQNPHQAQSPVNHPSYQQTPPSVHSPAGSTPRASHVESQQTVPPMYPPQHASTRPPRADYSMPSHHSKTEYHPQTPSAAASSHHHQQPNQGHVLPPLSSIQGIGKYRSFHVGTKRSEHPAPSTENSDNEDASDDLPASGLVAPWEILRGLADVAVEQAAKENGDISRSTSPNRQLRPAKRRKTAPQVGRPTFQDVVTKGIVTEKEARSLFAIFYEGCSTFLPVFDAQVDTYDALHQRSPFAVDSICMVAARVRDGGGQPSETYLKCLEEVQAISMATLFSPVTRIEAVQAMVLLSGWSDNGWLSGGHAVRMALELSLHKAWPKLLRRMKLKRSGTGPEDQELVVASRTWFTLYLFEHQLSYGTGRPAILKDDESIWDCRCLLEHPLAIEDDMRLVSTVELMAVRERLHNKLSPFDEPVNDEQLRTLREADEEFRGWFVTWDNAFAQKYGDTNFYRQSLQLQQLHAELFHNATALRGVNCPSDAQRMPPLQRELAVRSMKIAEKGLDLTINSPAYSQGLKYAVHYTHATATFAASFLLRLARLFPDDCDVNDIHVKVEKLTRSMSEISGKRYALTLQVMLNKSKKRKASSLSPTMARDPQRMSSLPLEQPVNMHQKMSHERAAESFSPGYDQPPYMQPQMPHRPHEHPHQPYHPMAQQHHQPPHLQQSPQGMPYPQDAENILRQFPGENLPVWLSDQSLGGQTLSSEGMNAFFLPQEYYLAASAQPPQIW